MIKIAERGGQVVEEVKSVRQAGDFQKATEQRGEFPDRHVSGKEDSFHHAQASDDDENLGDNAPPELDRLLADLTAGCSENFCHGRNIRSGNRQAEGQSEEEAEEQANGGEHGEAYPRNGEGAK